MQRINPLFVLRRTSTVVAVSILTLTLVSALTGLLIAINYQPIAGGAYQSLEQITQQVEFGWLVQGLHKYAGNFVIALGLVQLVLMFLGRQFRSSWLIAWISGIFLILASIGLDWTAMALSWTQEGFWRLKIELGTIEAIPFIGSTLREIVTGGGGINTSTLLRLYTLHSYILSLGAMGLAIAHLVGILFQDRQEQQTKEEQRKRLVEDSLNRLIKEKDRSDAATQKESASQT
ncbi:cytochrome b/b6/petB domain protein [Lyngbya aestuarii BL J]|uniref:Cytochrome b/b6/petB domain protein n=1 Tax=Lyngbya aestuarii BL J TaxID=1348334 RepID=U7QQD6_9CYAN|nr:cytochrome b N-terminal domain-containing protein [Lyngbya aestuarii]ERT09330.1 cytochrome b/b6/petB domain protein [Lyngbya aestuarii BL J]